MLEDQEFEFDFDWNRAENASADAYKLYESGQMTEALDLLDSALHINPANSALYFNKGLILDAMEQFDSAIDTYKQALETNPDDLEVYNCLAVDYTRTGMYDLAIATFERIAQIDPDFEPSFCNRIITYAEMGKHDKAEEMFYLAQQINPDCPICFYNIGNSLFCRKEYARAIWCWQKTAQLEPEHPQINYRIAQANWALGNIKLADQHFLTELRINPGNIEVLTDYAVFKLQQGDLGSAKEKFNRILELIPDYAPAYLYLGEIELQNDNITIAEKFFNKALSIDDQFTGPRFRLAQIAQRSSQNEKAIDLLKSELEFDITDTDVLLNMGKLFMAMEDYDFASHCFLKVADLDSQDYIPFFHLGLSMSKAGELEDSLHFFDYALDIKPDCTLAMTEKAHVHFQLGQYDQAKFITAQALKLDPENTKAEKLLRQIKLTKLSDKISSAWNNILKKFSNLR